MTDYPSGIKSAGSRNKEGKDYGKFYGKRWVSMVRRGR